MLIDDGTSHLHNFAYTYIPRAYEEKRACNSLCMLCMHHIIDESAGYAIFSEAPTRKLVTKIHVSLCFLCKNSKPIQTAELALFIYFLPLARLSLLYNISC